MIVRDAEATLPAALASACPHFDEIIVVDTGSMDGTRKLISGWDVKLFDFPWCDDFSAARNYSLEKATGDWIFWLDADDLLPAESAVELRRLVDTHPHPDVAYWVAVEETVSEPGGRQRTICHSQLRLLPRHSDVRFCYRVHEQVAPALERLGIPFKRSQIVVQHLGCARSADAQIARMQRNLRLGQMDLSEHPNDPFVHFSLGATYLFIADGLVEATNYLRRSIQGLAAGSSIQLNAYLLLGQAHGKQGDRRAERQTYLDALKAFPNDANLLIRLAGLYQRIGRYEEAERCLVAALEEGTVRLSAVQLVDGPARATLQLGRLYLQTGRRLEAEQLWRRFVQLNPGDVTVGSALRQLRIDPENTDRGG